MAYDAMGNYTGPDDFTETPYDLEEERKKKIREAANTLLHKREVSTYADGSQKHTTTQHVAAPVAPTAPAVDYNSYIAQQESGANPAIGYHDQSKGTAYGTYGLTGGAYQDARKANPALPQDITQATPEQQNQAMTAYTNQNAQYLKNYGVEATPGNLAGAHFLGARGLADYLKSGTISPAAAAANGGEDKVRAIVNARLGSQPSPASGALNPPATTAVNPAEVAAQPSANPSQYNMAGTTGGLGLQMPQPAAVTLPTTYEPGHADHLDAYQTNQEDPQALIKMGFDQSVPEALRARAKSRAAELLTQQRDLAEAEKRLQTDDPNQLADELRSKTTGGSYFKAILFNALGMKKSATDERAKLGIGKDTYGVDANGDTVIVKVAENGTPISGVNATTGKALPAKEMADFVATNTNADNKTLQTQAHHSAATAMDAMRKENVALANMSRPPRYSEEEVLQRGKDVYRQTLNVNRPGAATAAQTGLVKPNAFAQAVANATGKPMPTETAAPKDTFADSKVLGGWENQRPGENAKSLAKRLEIRPDDVENAARSLIEGRAKPSEYTGRGSAFRQLAMERANELDSKYTPQRYDQVDKVVKRYTSGKDHDTLVNTGTAVNHLMQFKDIAAQTPGNTNVSSWNTFYQNLSKYGNAPEIKSKEAMAGFVAGELVKAASGTGGSMTERIGLEKQLMAANTPAEITSIVDNSIKLAHGRYSSMKKSYESSTGRKDFDEISGMPDEARTAFRTIEAQEVAKKGKYNDADKEARYQAWKKQQGMQ
jgi:hypothetical protein